MHDRGPRSCEKRRYLLQSLFRSGEPFLADTEGRRAGRSSGTDAIRAGVARARDKDDTGVFAAGQRKGREELSHLAGASALAIPALTLGHSLRAHAQQLKKNRKAAILLWMNGGASQMDTFDMKPGTYNGGPFRPIQTKVPGMDVCEYLPKVGAHADKLAVIRSMKTTQPDHPDGIRSMHIGHKIEVNISHPEIGAIIAKFHGDPDADIPSCINLGGVGYGGSGGAGFPAEGLTFGAGSFKSFIARPVTGYGVNANRIGGKPRYAADRQQPPAAGADYELSGHDLRALATLRAG